MVSVSPPEGNLSLETADLNRINVPKSTFGREPKHTVQGHPTYGGERSDMQHPRVSLTRIFPLPRSITDHRGELWES